MSAVGFQSESQLLVETCLAQLRIDARLDDDPILPTIDVLPDVGLPDDDAVIEVDESELIIECSEVLDVPSAASIVRASVEANQRSCDRPRDRSQRDVPTLRTSRAETAVRHARWPVMLCALVAMYCGTTAFLRSPLGAKPEVVHVVKASRAGITNAVEATKALIRL